MFERSPETPATDNGVDADQADANRTDANRTDANRTDADGVANRRQDPSDRQAVALDALTAGIEAARPGTVIPAAVEVEEDHLAVAGTRYDLREHDEILVLGGGNAAGRVAAALVDVLVDSQDDRLDGGMVVTDDPTDAGPVTVHEGTHPLPSAANEQATRALLDRADAADERTLALVAVTGGGSALLTAPAGEITTDGLATLTDGLLHSGAPIDRINAVRRAVSDVKGGGLARALAPATTVGLVFSDVTDADPAVVASGPLSPPPTDAADALAVLAEYGVDAPASVRNYLDGAVKEATTATTGKSAGPTPTADLHVLADGFTALEAAAASCADAGYKPLVLSRSVRGEAEEAAKTAVAIAEEVQRSANPVAPPAAVLSGGETTVTVAGDGTGGPNQTFALSAALELPDGVTLAAVDTDGIDGPTDAAGALVTADTVPAGDPKGLHEARDALADDDAYTFLDDRNALLRSGPTGTNVNDLRVTVIHPASE